MNNEISQPQAPSKPFRIAAIAALTIGALAYTIGLVNANMALNEKGYYLIALLFGLFSAVSVQKSVRDKAEGVKTSNIYYALAWVASGSAIALLCIGLFNANLLLSEKGFFGMAFILSLFSAITVQKNVRDTQALKDDTPVVPPNLPPKAKRAANANSARTDNDTGFAETQS